MVTPETRKARGYAVYICILLKNISNLELGDSEEFPSLKILTAKTFGRYISINDKIAVENVEGLEGKSRVKKTPVKRAVSKKRPDVAVDEQVVKKKRTLKKKAAPSKAKLELVSVALDAEPIQTIDPTSADNVDTIIEQVVAETAQMDTYAEGTNVSEPDVGVQTGQRTDAMGHWFNASYEEFVAREAARIIESTDDTDEEIVADKDTGTDVGIQMETDPDAYFVEEPSEETELIQGTEKADVVTTTDEKKTDDESLSLEEILSTIPGGFSLPSSIGDIVAVSTVIDIVVDASDFVGVFRRGCHCHRLDDIRKDVDETKVALSNAILDFHAQAQENYNNLSSQLGELVAYINRGNDKKGEESSSRRPQPPPDDQNRPSGGSASRGGGSGGSGRRDDRRGSSTKRGSGSSGAGGT
ncbi:hypothetical protein F511_38324 [Dorcoceras hygrometricum]|uniref:Uncharacterized protein n=1 Tax=Dorcoceras hygrometricum TaxID=472368 RepID=A0A2Z7CMG4_9LAMI|nr:hypothetical protein F511_38324 [Dorcoceras hygrometricum]